MNHNKHHHAHPAEVNQPDHVQLTAAKIYTLQLSAGGQALLPAPNTHFFIISSTGPLAVQGDTFGQIDGLTTGQGMNNLPFNKLTLIDQSGASNQVKILIAPGEFTNQIIAATVAISSASMLAMRQSGSFVASAPALTTAQQLILAANSSRQYLLIQNNDPTITAFIFFANGAAAGIKLSPGQTFIQENIVTTQAVYMSASAATANVSVVTG